MVALHFTLFASCITFSVIERKTKLLPEMEAKERKTGLKKAAASFKWTAFAVFLIHFSQRMLLQGKSNL